METQDLTIKDAANHPIDEKLEGDIKKPAVQKEDQEDPLQEMKSLDLETDSEKAKDEKTVEDSGETRKDSEDKMVESIDTESKSHGEKDKDKNLDDDDDDYKDHKEPVFDGTEVPGMEANRSTSVRSSLDLDLEAQKVVEKAVALKNLVREKGEKSAIAVTSFLRRLSGRKDEEEQDPTVKSEDNPSQQRSPEKSVWKNPLSYLTMENAEEEQFHLPPHIETKGRIILYTRLGCRESREARAFFHGKRLRYVEINIDVYPGRKTELEKIAGSCSVPKIFFNEILVGGLSELKGLEESGKLGEKIDYLVAEAPSFEAPLPPLSGEDDLSNSGVLDETALIVRKMKESIVPRDRFYKLRWFTSCFLGSEVVDFISEDQYLEREEAVEFGRKLACQLFFHHVTGENVFEDGSHLYRFLEDDPIVSQCHNIPRGIADVKPKPIVEIASRLRFLSYAILEAYTSEDGKHVDYISIHGSEEFARYLRIVEELQRVELEGTAREEKLAFFINLYNMMTIHAILVWGHPAGNMERRRLFGEFRYVIGGSAYSLSSIQNGILRGNQRPPYNLMKPFGAKDTRSKVALPLPEPLIHFALVSGNQSGPALRCYSPGDIDKELAEAASNFLRNGGIIVDHQAKTVFASKILKWFSVDFGKNELEVLKYASKYLDSAISEALLDCIASSQWNVTYQPYDWRLNC